MKRIFALILAIAMVTGLSACGSGSSETVPKQPGRTVINVFAASSMTETLNAVKSSYEEANQGVEIVLTLDSSGTLKTQIEEGALCDLFISAAQKQMDALEETGLIESSTRTDLLENKCVLACAEGNPAGIKGFEDLGTDKLSLIALGNSDVPVGQYSEEILKNLGLWDALNDSSKITFGSSVKDVTAQVHSGAADCGIVYGTDAAAAGLEVIAEAPKGSHKQATYPAALVSGSDSRGEALAFLEYLQGETCRKIFENAGFTVIEH